MNKSENVEYKTLEQQIMALWKSRGLEVQTIRFQFATKTPDGDVLEWIIHAKGKGKVKKQQIQELWESRGIEVRTIQFQVAAKSPAGDTYEWIIHAKRKTEVKK